MTVKITTKAIPLIIAAGQMLKRREIIKEIADILHIMEKQKPLQSGQRLQEYHMKHYYIDLTMAGKQEGY